MCVLWLRLPTVYWSVGCICLISLLCIRLFCFSHAVVTWRDRHFEFLIACMPSPHGGGAILDISAADWAWCFGRHLGFSFDRTKTTFTVFCRYFCICSVWALFRFRILDFPLTELRRPLFYFAGTPQVSLVCHLVCACAYLSMFHC